MKLMFPSSYDCLHKVDPFFEEEYNIAKRAGHSISLYDHVAFEYENTLKTTTHSENGVVLRTYMMHHAQYEWLYRLFANRKIGLAVTPEQYRRRHYIDGYYGLIAHRTPKTVFCLGSDASELVEAVKGFGRVFIKDYAKSADTMPMVYEESYFLENHRAICSDLRRERGDLFFDGICLKQAVDIVDEYRVFVVAGRVVYSEREVPAWAMDIISAEAHLPSDRRDFFWTIDIGVLEDGSEIVIECGDAQVSSVKGDLDSFYKALALY